MINSLRRVFPVFEGPPPLLQLLNGLLVEPLLLQLAVKVLDVEARKLLVSHET